MVEVVVPVVIGALEVSLKDLIGGLKATDTTPCWSNAKNCLVGNCKDIEESVGNVKKRILLAFGRLL